jgi:acetyl-CoA decarbonylase/synthase complex subunit gamma
MLLPWIPGRAFSVKGALIGVLVTAGVLLSGWIPLDETGGRIEAVAWFFMIPAVSAFVGMNCTGTSTFTSLSGVKREMRHAVPAQIAAAAVGLSLWVVGLLLRG